MSLADFEQALATYFDGPRPEAEIADYRAKRGAAKKLRDEVVPVLHHIKFTKAKGEIRFQLNSDIPDCWLRDTPNATPQGLEVTVAQSREQQRLGQLMKGHGPQDFSSYSCSLLLRATPARRGSVCRHDWLCSHKLSQAVATALAFKARPATS